MTAERIISNVPEDADPQVVLTFNGKDGSEVKVTITLTVEGDLREVWTDLSGLTEREAVHQVAASVFQDLTRGA